MQQSRAGECIGLRVNEYWPVAVVLAPWALQRATATSHAQQMGTHCLVDGEKYAPNLDNQAMVSKTMTLSGLAPTHGDNINQFVRFPFKTNAYR
jgi:hypothetical protein